MRRGRSYFLVAAGILLVLMPFLTVLATPPDRIHVQREGGDNIGCDVNFDGISDETLEGRFWENFQETIRYNAAGEIETIRWNVSFHGELTIVGTGQVYKDNTAAVGVLNLADLIYTESGNTRHIFSPGEGTLWHDRGRIVLDVATWTPIFDSGHHELMFTDLDICGILGIGHYVSWEILPTTVKYLQGG